jgi:hypothetical protein
MKPVILLLVLSFIVSGFVLAEESANPAQLIIGKWKAADSSIYEFSDEKVLFVNDVKYATYRFVAGSLYLKYIASGDEFEADVVFELEENKMILTEYYQNSDEKILILKQVPQ